ncbi:uncharacterized protein PV07_09008 [Cladophialophora immunda]|uniref:ABM domain-containing protein n=1 Tax=Cladophialophora immunda TaxID=569365 RepID=A0A0D2ALF9_9EURO|nr:uncharacterized protein PV07_09008 [Cladophialophora immunda]KIW25872.1 hypothetical protein PV07_09008 [Cladophialophora immunda]OQV10425.1 hypothetical protein CLAIMM_14426 [Cladophialophora immunda]
MAHTSASTQMITFRHKPGINIKDPGSKDGKTWFEVVSWLKSSPTVRRLYWGLHLENENKVYLHIVREGLYQHYDFLASPDYAELKQRLQDIIQGDLIVRHADLIEYTQPCESLGNGAPFTGTAIYKVTDKAWDYAWNLWSTIVPRVKGCKGVAGGYIVEPVDGHQRCFIALVGWESTEEHHAYHETTHWKNRAAILTEGQKGFCEYGHIVFENEAQGPRL